MKNFGNSEMKNLFSESSHSSVTDADMLCLISTNERFLERFLSWIVFDNFEFGKREIYEKKHKADLKSDSDLDRHCNSTNC